MNFPAKFVCAFLLLDLTVVINAVGLTLILHRLRAPKLGAHLGFWRMTWMLIHIAARVVCMHLAGIAIWAFFYWWQHCLPNFETSLYFSAITYTTVGYGDVVLSPEWRLFSGVEALTGILMCGLSVGLFVAVVSRLYAVRPQAEGRDDGTRSR